MSKVHLFLGITLLLWSVTAIAGQDHCQVPPCDPNQLNPQPCDPCGTLDSPFTFGGWVEAGVYVNGNDNGHNGPLASASQQRTDFQMNQLYFFGEKAMNTKSGFDWGGRADFVYGTDALDMQCADETFDFDWGNNRHGYGMAAYQLYGTLGYKDLSVKVGKFKTPVGWEESASRDNFFYSHSYCYWIEPATHTGILATYNMTDRLTLNAGWTTGENSSFDNPNENSAALFGASYALTDKATVSYWFNGGKRDFDNVDYFVQSLCLDWALTDRFTYVFQYNLRNENEYQGNRGAAYGINNHFLYQLTDQWSVGTRLEWLRNSNCYPDDVPTGDYWEVTLGLNWNPWENVSLRPEVRYDWCRGGTLPFGEGTRDEQVTGGVGMIVSF